METAKSIDECLWDYIDGTCNTEEKAFTEQHIDNNNIWKARYIELLELNQAMDIVLEPEQPPMRFTKNVMDKIENVRIAPAANTYINRKLVTGMAIFFGVLISGLLIYAFARTGWITNANKDIQFDAKKYIPVFVDVLLPGNIVLLLLLLDKYLSIKRAVKKFQ